MDSTGVMLRRADGFEVLVRSGEVETFLGGGWTRPGAVDPQLLGAPRIVLPKDPPPVRLKPVVLAYRQYLDPQYGGGETSHHVMLAAVAAAGMEVHAAGWSMSETPDLPWAKSVRKADPDGPALAALLDELKPDVAVSESHSLEALLPLCRARGIALVSIEQFWRNVVARLDAADFEALHQRPIPRDRLFAAGLAAISGASAVVSNSDFTAEVVADAANRRPALVVFPPIDPAPFVAAAASGKPRRWIVLPAAQEAKGGLVFLDLARALPKERFLVLQSRHCKAGDARMEAALAKAPKNVEVRPWTPDFAAVLAEAKAVFIGTNTCESFCRGAAEALAAGVPLVLSDRGNLSRFQGPAVFHVKAGAPLARWKEALAMALAAGQQKPDPSWCRDDSARFADLVGYLAHNRRALTIACGGPGALRAAELLAQVTGAQIALPGSLPDLRCFDLVIQSAACDPSVLAAVQAAGGKSAVWWHSHLAQMSFESSERAAFLAAISALREGRLWRVLTTAPTVDLPGVEVLPTPFLARPLPCGPVEKFADFTVALIGPEHGRKNLWTAAEAVRRAGGILAHSPTLSRLLEPLAAATGLRCVELDPTPANLASCHVGLCASLAETFCLAAAEMLAAGLPVVGWAGIPALAGDGAVRVTDPCDPASLARALVSARTIPAAKALEHARDLAFQRSGECRLTLARLVRQARGKEPQP
jgi:glycosyltransferase involved in cell wall biosynthesis